MKLVLDDVLSDELKEYLLSQTGITNVNIKTKDFISEVNIEYTKQISPEIILKYINLFCNNEYSVLLSFDKGTKEKTKKLQYAIDDICCDNCYKILVQTLFEDKAIKSVNSNYDYNNSTNVEFIIEYNDNYKEADLIKFIEENK